MFDVLCDLWFIPKIGLYLKAFFGPFYYQYTPEKALENFETIGLTRAMTVKGFLNLFPALKKVILPKNSSKVQSNNRNKKPFDNKEIEKNGFESDTSNCDSSSRDIPLKVEEKEEIMKENPENNKKYNINRNSFVNVQSTVIFQSESFKPENIPMTIREDVKKAEISKGTRQKNNKKNNRIPVMKGIISNKIQKDFFYDEMFEKKHEDHENPLNNGFFRSEGENLTSKKKNLKKMHVVMKNSLENNEKNEFPKTKILSSCKKNEKEIVNALKIDENAGFLVSNTWDNRKKFELKQIEEKKKMELGDSEENQVKGVFNIVNILNEIKKNGILSKVNNHILMKLLGLSSIGLLLQLKFNKKARDWMVNSFMYIGFSAIFMIFGSSLALIIVKSLKGNRKTRKIENEDNR